MNSRLFSQYRIDIKKLIRIATPIGLAQLAQTGMSTVDVIMAGRVSSADVGGVGIGCLYLATFGTFRAGAITRLATNDFLFKWIWAAPSHCSPSETRPLDFIFSDDSPCTHHLS